MFIKPRTYPLEIRRLEGVRARLQTNHILYNEIDADLSRRRAGFKGELASDYYLDPLKKSKEHLILCDLKLPIHEHTFQIDTLILTRSYILIFEVKNITGELTFDHTYQQLVQTTDGLKKIYPCPIDQVENIERKIVKFFRSMKVEHSFPVKGFIVLANKRAQVMNDKTDKKVVDRVIRSKSIEHKIELLDQTCSKTLVSMKELKKLANMIKRSHDPWFNDFGQQYHDIHDDILCGVRCSECGHLPMTRVHGCWQCFSCQRKSKKAHREALVDYGLFKSNKITVKAFAEFALIDSHDVAYRLLNELKLPSYGPKKYRVYDLTSFIIKHVGNECQLESF
ncbi:nuclease-related domain-containing protein [Evansella halocellulosilytica]|uniref:nuclease-related domain-containing protein n=1 Tax=Evansella halocellulosilytica TaxID=2011013 RepID=UPI0015CD1F82|nr:nuclease-related domain-containing protein [Evansella halocellulosilytica]